MPDFCAAYGCSNRRNDKTKELGITFHKVPNETLRRLAWTAALRREGFEPKGRTMICSCHFKPEDFDRTGQTTRLREGAVPSVFNFPDNLPKERNAPKSSRTSEEAAAQCPSDESRSPLKEVHPSEESISDHQYAFDPEKGKIKLAESQKRVERLYRDLRNSRDRERRRKKILKSLLEFLKDKEFFAEELQEKLDFYSGTCV